MSPFYVTIIKGWGAVVSSKMIVKVYAKDFEDVKEVIGFKYKGYEVREIMTEKSYKNKFDDIMLYNLIINTGFGFNDI